MKKNICLIVLDTFRAAEFSDSNSDIAPNLQSLADNGTNFTSTYSTAPWTLPSHASLFTGTYSSKHGAHAGHKLLDDTLVTLPEIFQEHGYQTVGVSNNTWVSDEFGFGRGFDQFFKTWQYFQSSTDLGEIARTKEGTDKLQAIASRLLEGNPFVNLTNALYGKFVRKHEDDGANRSNEFINNWLSGRDTQWPFFLFVNYLEPHLEYRPSKEYAMQFLPDGISYKEAMAVPQDAWGYIAGTTEMSEIDFEILRALYRAEIAYLDERIGELKNALIETGEWEDTVFIVTADHGENIGDHDLMDHQYCLYDTLLHVPLVVNGRPFSSGTETDELVQLVDLAPTLLDTVGIAAPDAREQFQGQSFHPDSDTEPREHAIAEYMAPQPSMAALEKRVGSIPNALKKFDRSLRAIRSSEYKLIRGSDGSRELYHITSDPDEKQDLSNGDHGAMTELEIAIDEWLSSFEHAENNTTVSMKDETKQRLEDLGYLQ